MLILVVQSGLRTFREKQKVHDVGLEKGGGEELEESKWRWIWFKHITYLYGIFK